MLPQVNDKSLIEFANEFIKDNSSGNAEQYIQFLRDTNKGDFKPKGHRHKDAIKSFNYAKRIQNISQTTKRYIDESMDVDSFDLLNKKIKSSPSNQSTAEDQNNSIVIENNMVRPMDQMSNEFHDQNSVKINTDDLSNRSFKTANRNKRVIKKSANFNDYLNSFISLDEEDDLIEELFPFPEQLKIDFESFLTTELAIIPIVLLSGNSRCGKSTFIKSIAKQLNFHYVEFLLPNISQFSATLFWMAVKKFLEEHDQIIVHCQLNRCTSKTISNFQLVPSNPLSGRVVIIYECDDSSELVDWADYCLRFPSTLKNDRERMFEYFLKSVPMADDLTYEIMAKWTPGFEIRNIQILSHTLKKSTKDTNILTKEIAEKIIKDYKSERYNGNRYIETPNVSWSDISGHDTAKKELLAITNELNNEIDLSRQNGVLLFGPPGCGKTMLAKALSTELEFNFISICCSEILSKFQGESEKKVSEAFNRARSSEPCILFFDEIDALCSQRDVDNSGSRNTIVNVFLTQLDGINSHKNSRILVLGATNFKDQIDTAVKRSGRLGKHIEITIPKSANERFSVLMASSKNGRKPNFYCNIENKEENEAENIFNWFSHDKYTKGWTHADLAGLISRSDGIRKEEKAFSISMEHVKSAYIKMNKERHPKIRNEIISTNFVNNTEILLFNDNETDLLSSLNFDSTLMSDVNRIQNKILKKEKGVIYISVGGQSKSGKSTLIKLMAKKINHHLVTFKGDYFNKFNFENFLKEIEKFQERNGATMFHIVEKESPEVVMRNNFIKANCNIRILIVSEKANGTCCDLIIPPFSLDDKIRLINQCLVDLNLTYEVGNIESLVTKTDNWGYDHFEVLSTRLDLLNGPTVTNKELIFALDFVNGCKFV